MPHSAQDEVVLVVLLRALRALGWQWKHIRCYLGVSFEALREMRDLYGIEAIAHQTRAPRYSYAQWESDDAFDEWFLVHDSASPFRR